MWGNYMVIAQLELKPPAYKVALFLHCIGVDALKIFNGFQFDTPDDRHDLAKIIQKFDEFTIGELNETFERYTFNSRNQQENESIDAYVTALRTLAKTCNFCDCMRDSIIRDRVVLGIKDHRTRKRLLQERSLTLAKCIDLCKGSEATNLQLKTISGGPRTKMFTLCKINTRLQAAMMTSLGKAARGRRRPVNFVAKHILSKKESVQRGARNVRSAVAEITSQQPALLRPEKCTT